MEKGEMYFRIIEEGYVREDNSAKIFTESCLPWNKTKLIIQKVLRSKNLPTYYILMFGLCLMACSIFFPQSLHILKVTALEAVAYFLTETFHGFFEVAKTATTCVKASSFTIFN